MQYGKRYYDGFCRICVNYKKSVFWLQGICLQCFLQKIVVGMAKIDFMTNKHESITH